MRCGKDFQRPNVPSVVESKRENAAPGAESTIVMKAGNLACAGKTRVSVSTRAPRTSNVGRGDSSRAAAESSRVPPVCAWEGALATSPPRFC